MCGDRLSSENAPALKQRIPLQVNPTVRQRKRV